MKTWDDLEWAKPLVCTFKEAHNLYTVSSTAGVHKARLCVAFCQGNGVFQLFPRKALALVLVPTEAVRPSSSMFGGYMLSVWPARAFLGRGPCTPHAHTMLSKFSLDRASAAASAQVSDGVYESW